TSGAFSPGSPSIRSYVIAPDGHVKASAATSSGVALSGCIHSRWAFGTKTSGRPSTQLREWMHFRASKRITTFVPRTSSILLAMVPLPTQPPRRSVPRGASLGNDEKPRPAAVEHILLVVRNPCSVLRVAEGDPP